MISVSHDLKKETDVFFFDEEGETDVLSFVCFFVDFVTGLEAKVSLGSSEVWHAIDCWERMSY